MRQRSAPLIPFYLDYTVSWNSGITLPDHRGVRKTGPLTMMAGFIPHKNPQNNFGYLLATCNNVGSGGLRFMIDSYGPPLTITTGFTSSTGGTAPYITGSYSAFAAGDYVDAATTYDGGILASGINTYIGINGAPATLNGVAASGNGSGVGVVTAGIPITIGNRPGGARVTDASSFYTALWDRVLDLQEIRKVQKLGPLAVRDSMVLCWANDRDWGPADLSPTAKVANLVGRQSPFAPRLRIGRAAFAAESLGFPIPVIQRHLQQQGIA